MAKLKTGEWFNYGSDIAIVVSARLDCDGDVRISCIRPSGNRYNAWPHASILELPRTEGERFASFRTAKAHWKTRRWGDAQSDQTDRKKLNRWSVREFEAYLRDLRKGLVR